MEGYYKVISGTLFPVNLKSVVHTLAWKDSSLNIKRHIDTKTLSNIHMNRHMTPCMLTLNCSMQADVTMAIPTQGQTLVTLLWYI